MDDYIINFLEYISKLCESGRLRKAIRKIFEQFIKLTEDGDVNKIDNFFKYINPELFPIEINLAFLSITSCLKERLLNRNNFFNLLVSTLEKKYNVNEIEQLLKGL